MSIKSVAMIFTDAACIPNPGPGGYAALLRCEGQEAIIKGGELKTTNNRMEMMAAIKAFEMVPPGQAVALHSDNQYLIDGMSKWLTGWKIKGWHTSRDQPVMNDDLWKILDVINAAHSIEWRRIKVPKGKVQNDPLNGLARTEAKRQARLALSMMASAIRAAESEPTEHNSRF